MLLWYSYTIHVTVRAVGTNVSCMFACVFYLFHVLLYIQDGVPSMHFTLVGGNLLQYTWSQVQLMEEERIKVTPFEGMAGGREGLYDVQANSSKLPSYQFKQMVGKGSK